MSELDARLAEAIEEAYACEGYVGGPIAVAARLVAAKFLADVGIDERVVRAVADGDYAPASVTELQATLRDTERVTDAAMAVAAYPFGIMEEELGRRVDALRDAFAKQPTRTPPSTPTTGS